MSLATPAYGRARLSLTFAEQDVFPALPAGTVRILKSIQCANTTGTTDAVTVTIKTTDGATAVLLAEDLPVDAGDAREGLTGDQVMIAGDKLIMSCSSDGDAAAHIVWVDQPVTV